MRLGTDSLCAVVYKRLFLCSSQSLVLHRASMVPVLMATCVFAQMGMKEIAVISQVCLHTLTHN